MASEKSRRALECAARVLARRVFPVSGVENLRRRGLGDDPDFMARYRDAKRGTRRQLGALFLGIGLIGRILLGVCHWGWTW
jgi:hypothetical protein